MADEKRLGAVRLSGVGTDKKNDNLGTLAESRHPRNANRFTFADAAAFAADATRRCLLCARKAHWRAVFIPDEPRLWPGGPVRPGKVRGLFYGLCRKCWKRRDRVAAVEAHMLAHGKEQATHH